MPVDRDRVATSTMHLTLPDTGDTDVTITETAGRHPIPLLHGGGGGPLTVSSFATQLAADETRDARVITPIHPGFDGTPRPDRLADIAGLAALYVALLDQLDINDVTVIGNSIGG